MVTPGVANFWKGESNRGKKTAPTAQDHHPSCRLHTRIAVCECYSLTRDPSNGNSCLPTGFNLAWPAIFCPRPVADLWPREARGHSDGSVLKQRLDYDRRRSNHCQLSFSLASAAGFAWQHQFEGCWKVGRRSSPIGYKFLAGGIRASRAGLCRGSPSCRRGCGRRAITLCRFGDGRPGRRFSVQV